MSSVLQLYYITALIGLSLQNAAALETGTSHLGSQTQQLLVISCSSCLGLTHSSQLCLSTAPLLRPLACTTQLLTRASLHVFFISFLLHEWVLCFLTIDVSALCICALADSELNLFLVTTLSSCHLPNWCLLCFSYQCLLRSYIHLCNGPCLYIWPNSTLICFC